MSELCDFLNQEVPAFKAAEMQREEEARQAESKRAGESRMRQLEAVVLYDRGEEYRKIADAAPELAYLNSEHARQDPRGRDMLLGQRVALDFHGGDVRGGLRRTIDGLPEEERRAWEARFGECKDERDGMRLLGELARTRTEGAWDAWQRREAERKADVEGVRDRLERELPGCVIEGRALPADLWGVMEKYSDETRADEVRESLERAQAAFAAIQWRSHGGSRRDYEGRVRAKADELREKWRDGVHWAWTDEPSEDEYLQQARAEVGSDVGVEVDREFLAGVAAMLRADGKMDERAAAMLAVALWQDARGEQTIDSKFCRNLVTEMERWGQSALDYMAGGLVKSAAKTGVLYTGPDTPPVYYTEAQRAALATEVARDFSPDVETLRSYVSKALDERLDASAQADMLSAAATKVGTITGDTAPILLAQTLAPGVGGFLAGSALMFPSTAGRMRADAYAEGLKHPELVGNVGAFFETAAEAGFGPLSKFPGVSRVIDKAALRLVGVPVLGRAIGAVQGNAALRYATGTVIGESAGELVGENVVSETGTYLTLNGLRAVGMDLDAPEWAPFLHSWQGMQDARQTGATVAYCALIGLGGVRGDMQRARAFAEDQRRLMTAGMSSEGAAKVASLAERQRGKAAKLLHENRAVLEEARDKAREKALEAGRKGKKAKGVLAGAEEDKRIEAAADAAGAAAAERKALELTAPLDNELRELMQEVYRTDVLYADPLKVRERMRREHELYMSDVEAQTALREGILKAALREAGVLDVKLGTDGRNLVHLKARGEDGAEGDERVVEWTDEQLAAFSQYAIGNENLRRMKAIRSAALAIDMAGKIDGRGYAETLPLTAEVAPVAAALAKSRGKMTLDVLDALGKAALHAEKRGVDLLPGVSNSVVGNAAASLVERARWDSGAGWRGVMSGRAGAMAMRMPMRGRAASKLVYLRGQTKSVNMVEDAVESMLYRRLVEVGGVSPEGSTTAAGREWLEGMMADMRRVNAEVKRMTGRELASGLEDAEATLMNVVEYFSHLAQSSFYQRAGSAGLGEAARRHVEFMDAALVSAKLLGDMGAGFNAWAATEAGRKWAAQGGTLATLLQEAGHEMGALYEMSALTAENVAAVEAARREARVANRARIDAQDVQARMQAVGLAEAEAKAPGGCGGASASRVVQEAESEEEAIRAAEEAAPVTRKEKHEDALRHDEAVLTMHSGEEGAEVPDAVRSVFVDGHCVHNASGGYYCGIVDTAKVRGVSAKEGNVGGKDGEGASAAAGLAENVAPAEGPLHLLLRKDGSLEPIGGGERLAMLKGAPTVQQHLCYVYVEGDEFAGVRFDEGWARMLGYELSMREGTADEVTAGRYARETGYSEEYMTRKGLMCEATRSKRGINIGRQAGEELWKRFADGEVSAKDADTICRLTAPLAARARVADIQAACCRMLAAGKSWEYIGAMVQLQALGVDADADMDRMAQFVERNIHVLDEAIGALKGARTRQNAPEQAERLADLERIRAGFELVGSQPEMLAQARRWDGETEPDPVGEYQGRAARKRERERRESGLDAEGYLKAKDTQISASLQDKLRVTASSIKEIRPPKTQPLCNIYTAKAGEETPASPNKVTVKQWLQRAAETIPELDDLITKVCKATKCRKMMRKGTKKEARILQKAKNDYGGEINQVIDMVGGTVIVPSRGNYREVVRRIQQQVRKQRLQIVKLKKLGFEDEGPGYHDIKISVRFSNGIIGEIIVVSEFINKAKFDRGGHLVYEVKRNLEPLVESHKQVRKAIRALNELSATIYNASADSDALESSKSKAAEELTALRELLQNVSSSEEVNGVVKSFDTLLNLIKPASVSSTAAFISSQTQNISKDDVPQESGDVNKKNQNFSASEQDEEIKAIREAAIADNTFMKAPNGKPTNLTERQWLQVRTRAFKAWFGDWENDPEHASKVLDENGEPLVVYHFTDSVFTAFDVSKARQNADIPAIFFSSGTEDWAAMGGRVMACYLNIRNPKEGKPIVNGNGREVRDALVAEGYDGTIDRDEDVEEVEYAAFRPEQVKSATENRGTFDGGNADITHSLALDDAALDGVGGMEMASAHALAVLEARADEAYAAQLAREFRRKAEAWSLARVRGDEKDGRLGRGAKLFGELMALVDAAELTLGAAANTGRLHFLLAWARVYAGMMEDGSAPMGGELKGEIYDAFVERMREREADARRHGLTDEEVQEMMAEYAGERLDIAMDRVLRHVLGSLDGFLKARARERMDYLREKAYPKRPEGKPWPRGKMSAENYRRVEEIYRYLEMDAERVADLIEGKKQALERLREEGVGDDAARAREEELEDELALLAMYGCWESKSAEEAQAAAASFADFVLNGRRAWQEKLRQERRRLAWQRKEIARHFKGARDELLEKGAQRNAKESASDMNIGKSSMRGYMNMSHLLKSLEGRMGSRWTSGMRQRLADIHEGLQVFLGNLEGWLLEDVRACTGLTKEADMEDWMRSIHEVYDTGIILRVPLPGQTVQLTPEEARMWLSLTAQEREAKRKEMLAAAEAAEEAADNVPTDEQIEELRRKVAGSWLAGAASGRERMSGAWSAARQEKLRAAREAKEAELGRELTREEVSQLTEEHGRLTKEELKAAREAMVDALAAELPAGAVTENENAPAYFFLKGSEMTEQRLVTTKATLLQAVLTFDQPDYEHLMEANGVDDAVLAEMRRQIGPALLELGYRMRQRLNENGVRMAKVYENLTGVPFGFRANYFKGCFDTGKPSTQGEAVEREGSSTTASGKHGMLIPRRFHTLLIPWQTNVSAVSVYLQAMKEQNRYELTADFVHELRALFADRVFAMECRAEIGDTNMDLLLGWTRLVEGSLVASEKQQNFINKLIGKFISAMAVVRLAFNVNTYVKQCTAVNNAYLGGYVPAELGYKDDGVQVLAERHVGLAEWHAAMGRVMSGRGVVGLRELAKSDMFAYRDRKDGAHLAQAALLGPNRKVGGRVGKASRAVYEAGMAPIGKLDVGSNVVGAAILYDATWHHLEAEDRDGRLSDAERHELCRMTVRKMLDFAAQPVLRTQKSYHAAAGTFGSFGSNMFLFRSESVKNFGGWMAQVLNGETGAAVAGNAFFGVANALLVGMLSWLAGFWPDEDDEDRWAKVGTKFTLDALTGDLASVPVLDDIVMGVRHLVEQQVENATDVKVKSPRFQDKGALFDLLDAAQREYRNMEEGSPWQRHVSAVTRLLGSVGACTAFCKNSAVGPLSDVASLAWAAAACGNMAKFMRNVYDRVDEEDA